MPTDQNITDILADEAAATENGRDMDAQYVATKRRSKDPAQVYSVRLPADRIEELRQLAARQGVAPSALLRRWALERLDREIDHASRVEEARENHDIDKDDDIVILTRAQLDSEIHRYVSEHGAMIGRMVQRQMEESPVENLCGPQGGRA